MTMSISGFSLFALYIYSSVTKNETNVTLFDLHFIKM